MGEPPERRSVAVGAWLPDEHVAGFETLTLPLAVDALPEEGDVPLVGTLVRRQDRSLRAHARAIVHVHGWNDYFFHGHVADFYEAQGVAFYALDLRRYGRSWATRRWRATSTRWRTTSTSWTPPWSSSRRLTTRWSWWPTPRAG
ncbi:MAG: hypothetical protein IPL36_04350 [Nigerium sp.]|nr:hypothetical protein [Nigerium sp.]